MRWGRLLAGNYRGVQVPRILGAWLAASAAASTLTVAAVRHVGAEGWGALAGAVLVFAAGLLDDLSPGGPRGLRNHLRFLAAGRMTTGIVKLLVAVGASVVIVALQPPRETIVRLAGIVLLAAGANVWNGLDVAPGRALKAFLPLIAAVIAASPPVRLVPLLPGLAIGAVPALAVDLRERAMLGDGGSNLLGLAAGLGLYAVLPGWAVVVAALAAVALNVLADTLTFTRAIQACPPLRWLDRAGRLGPPA